MRDKKYKLTDETTEVRGHILYRIEAIVDFDYIKKGYKGGFIEKESNLSHEGDCWVGGNAKVFEDAQVLENSQVFEDAQVLGDAKIYGNSQVYGNSKIYGNSEVYGKAFIYEYANILGKAKVCGDVEIRGNAVIQTDSDYLVFKNNWSSGRYFTWTRSNNMWKVGCFYGTGKELIEKAYKDSPESGKKYEATVKYVETIFLND